jgi:hypothetical protein
LIELGLEPLIGGKIFPSVSICVMAVCFLCNLWIDHNNVIADCIFTILQVKAILLSGCTATMQEEVNVATFFKALVGVENESMPLETMVLEPSSFHKVMLSEFFINTLGCPVIVLVGKSLNFGSWDVCEKMAKDFTCGVKLTITRVFIHLTAILGFYLVSWVINDKCMFKIFGLE